MSEHSIFWVCFILSVISIGSIGCSDEEEDEE